MHRHHCALLPRQAHRDTQGDSRRDLGALPRRQRDRGHRHPEAEAPQGPDQTVSIESIKWAKILRERLLLEFICGLRKYLSCQGNVHYL